MCIAPTTTRSPSSSAHPARARRQAQVLPRDHRRQLPPRRAPGRGARVKLAHLDDWTRGAPAQRALLRRRRSRAAGAAPATSRCPMRAGLPPHLQPVRDPRRRPRRAREPTWASRASARRSTTRCRCTCRSASRTSATSRATARTRTRAAARDTGAADLSGAERGAAAYVVDTIAAFYLSAMKLLSTSSGHGPSSSRSRRCRRHRPAQRERRRRADRRSHRAHRPALRRGMSDVFFSELEHAGGGRRSRRRLGHTRPADRAHADRHRALLLERKPDVVVRLRRHQFDPCRRAGRGEAAPPVAHVEAGLRSFNRAHAGRDQSRRHRPSIATCCLRPPPPQ